MSRFAVVLSLTLALAISGLVQGADAPAVKSSIDKGVQFLKTQVKSQNGATRTLMALALVKAGVPGTAPEVQEVVSEVARRCTGNAYEPGGEHIYEAGVEATLLADVSAEKYRRELTLIRDYLVQQQLVTGAWDYPTGRSGGGYVGDTSVTQYGCLGLWAVARAGIEIDPAVWDKIIDWHIQYQNDDGGFAYCPGVGIGQFGQQSTLNMSVNAVGNLHIAMLQKDPAFVPIQEDRGKNKSEEQPKFGILEQVEVSEEGKVPAAGPSKTSKVSDAAIAAVRKAYGYVAPRFRVENKASNHFAYYYYSLERTAALANVTSIDGHDWYEECSSYIVEAQSEDGSWRLSRDINFLCDTCFCVLFLTRSTGKLLKRVPGYGDGILIGGRGLPDDLKNLELKGEQIRVKETPKEPLEQLLASLQNTGDVQLEDLQSQIVEKIQLGDRKELIGQVDQLIKLVGHPSPEIRRTAVWAIGRSDKMQLAKYLISALDDPDVGVIIEAQNALCWLSRKPTGFGFAEDPLADLPPAASEVEQKAATAAWHRDLVIAWGSWYLRNQPYDQRGDPFETRLRLRIGELKRQTVAQ